MFFVVVEHNSQEDRHEDVRVDEDVQDEEQGKNRVGVVCRHPANEKQTVFITVKNAKSQFSSFFLCI